ncbi:MAG: SDR family oxidoreductase [Bacteroidia bacterium]|nr:SDR family oxidoreductase [Bacteroidia bacterium]
MLKKKILVTGSNGLLGQKLIHALAGSNTFELIATSKGENRCLLTAGYTYHSLDITNKNKVEEVFQNVRPDIVIHTAAMTNVDACEQDHSGCLRMNVDAVSYLVEASEKHQAHLIHLSTDFIFNGTHGPLSEEEKPDPLSFYGHSKLQGEKLVQQSKCKWAIVRTVLVYGVVDGMSRSNIVLWAKDALEKGKSIPVVDDQFRTPTLAEDLAAGCILIAEKGATGVFHISGKDFMSVYDLALRVADFWKLDKSLIRRAKSTDIKQPAQRPPITGFILYKAKVNLGYTPKSFEEGLQILNNQLTLSNH